MSDQYWQEICGNCGHVRELHALLDCRALDHPDECPCGGFEAAE